METAALPVKMYCPFFGKEQDVFFHPVQIDGKWYIDINSFNGCDNNWHSCQECEDCKAKAYAKLFSQDK